MLSRYSAAVSAAGAPCCCRRTPSAQSQAMASWHSRSGNVQSITGLCSGARRTKRVNHAATSLIALPSSRAPGNRTLEVAADISCSPFTKKS